MTRHQKVQAIYDLAKKRKNDLTTLTFLLAMMSDKGVTKFYNDYVVKNNSKVANLGLEK